MKRKKGLAVFLVISGSVVYGLQPLFLKSSSAGPMTDACSTFFRFLVCTILTGGILLARKRSVRISKRQALELGLFGIFGYGFTNFLLFLAFKTISVSIGIMCNYAYPALVLAIMMLFFKERCTLFKVSALAACVAGLLIIILSKGELDLAGLTLSLLSAVTYAAYIIANDQCSFGKLDGLTIIFYIFLFTALFFGICTLCKGELTFRTTAPQLINNLLSAITTVVSICCLTYGIQVLGASMAAFFCMSEPVTSILADAFLLHTRLSPSLTVGTVLILTAVLFIAVGDHFEGKRKNYPTPYKELRVDHDKRKI